MVRRRSPIHPAARTPRPARRIHEEGPDKLPELATCPDCRASYRNGRWTWTPAPADAYETVCPACERIAADYPAGVLELEGDFVSGHRDELRGLLQNLEERERTEHPLKRIMAIQDEGASVVVTVTDAKLARSLGQALHRAYEGQLEQPPTTSDVENLVRVRWRRDA
jgi:NMD protein affecting ribosome stability and mRNA decay